MRTLILIVALVFTVGIGIGTVAASRSRGGVGPLEIVGLVVVAMFAFGVVGALLHPPEK